MTDLAQQMEVLARRLDALEVENSQLREQLDDSPAAGPTESRRFGRRNLLRLGGAAAAVGVGSVLLRPGVAGATTGNMQFGDTNNAVGDETTLISSHGVSTLSLTNSLSGAALRATNSGSGMGISVHTSNSANTLTALNVTDDGQGGAIFCEVTNATGSGPAIFGIVSDSTATVPVYEAENDGKGHAMYAHVDNPASAGRALFAKTIGTQNAVLASIANSGSTASSVRATTNGAGAGVEATSSKGVGGKFTGSTAQVQLVPGTRSSHPPTGGAGQLYVDKSKRLWYCKGGTSWKQLA